jgi:hypothetical protein
MKSIMLALFALGCIGSLEDECGGDHQMSQRLAGPPDGSCMIVEIADGSEGEVGIGDSCPVGRCAILGAGEHFRIWKDALSPDPEYNTATLPLDADGNCLALCPEE